MLILVQDDELHLVNQSYSTENNALIQAIWIYWNTKNTFTRSLKGVMGHDSCKLFYSKRLSLLSGHLNTATKACMEVTLVPFRHWDATSIMGTEFSYVFGLGIGYQKFNFYFTWEWWNTCSQCSKSGSILLRCSLLILCI